MLKIFNNKYFLFTLFFLLASSFSVFSLQQITITYYSLVGCLLTMFISFITSFFVIYKTNTQCFGFIKGHPFLTVFICLAACQITLVAFENKGLICTYPLVPIPFETLFRLRGYLIALPSLCYLGIIIVNYILLFFKNLFANLKKEECVAYLIVSTFFSLLVIYLYTTNNMWYLQYDQVYSMDSAWVLNDVYPILNYYDIRHPLFSILLFPCYAIINGVTELFAPLGIPFLTTPILLQIFHTQLLLLSGLMLRKIANNPFAFWLYIVSFPTLIFSFTFEKYQIITFFIILYIYTLWQNQKSSSIVLILSIGTMPTNAFLVLFEAFTNSSVKEKIMQLCKITLYGILILFCFGRFYLLNLPDTLYQITSMHTEYGTMPLTFVQRIFTTLNMIESSFEALPSSNSPTYTWASLTNGISIIGLLIISVITTGILTSFKSNITKMVSLWGIFPFLLFVIMNWAPHESPLFALVFSWAYIYLFIKGLDWISVKTKINLSIIYYILLCSIFIKNIIELFSINQYLLHL